VWFVLLPPVLLSIHEGFLEGLGSPRFGLVRALVGTSGVGGKLGSEGILSREYLKVNTRTRTLSIVSLVNGLFLF
jgi:hypothetical protein